MGGWGGNSPPNHLVGGGIISNPPPIFWVIFEKISIFSRKNGENSQKLISKEYVKTRLKSILSALIFKNFAYGDPQKLAIGASVFIESFLQVP